MGNRGNVIFTDGKRYSPAVYLHWNGGPESVYAFLSELDRRDVRADTEYDAARFVQLVGEFFDNRKVYNGLSLGIVNTDLSADALLEGLRAVYTDGGDNGFYVVNRDAGTMRRFSGYDESFAEWSPEVVARERQSAEKNATYAEGLAEFFQDPQDPRNAETVTS
jgi:hypothetical protein